MILEHFIVWMRTAGLPNFRKLWARIDGDLEAGTYTINVVNSKSIIRSFALLVIII